MSINLDLNKLLTQTAHALRQPTRKFLNAVRRTRRWARRHSLYNTFPRLRPWLDKIERCGSYLTGMYVFFISVCFLMLVLIGQNPYSGIRGFAAYADVLAMGLGMLYLACLLIARGNELRGKVKA